MANLLKTLFGKNPQTTQQPQDQQPQAQTPMQQAANTGLTMPAQGQATQAPSTEQSLLDLLGNFMQNKGQGQEAAQPPKFQIPQEELGKIVSGQDFTKSIPQELMQRLSSGDLSALPEVLNSVGRASYQAALTHSMGLTDSFVSSRFQHEQSNLQGVVDQRLTTRSLDAAVKNMHPVAQKFIKDMAADFRKQFPNASEEDIMETAMDSFKEFAAQANNDPASVAAKQQANKAAPNWDNFGDFDIGVESTNMVPAGSGGQTYQ